MSKAAILAAIAAPAVLLAGCSSEADAKVDKICTGVADLAATTLRGRQAGMTEDAALELLRAQKVYSGVKVWAVKSAYEAPADMSESLFRGSVFGECVKRGGE